MGKINETTKEYALHWIKDNRNSFPPHRISYMICRRCIYGDDYEDIDDRGNDVSQPMSVICRAYNITDLGSTSNRIKSVFKKYRNIYSDDRIEEAIDEIVRQYPNGIPNEEPKFKELLDRCLNNTVTPKTNAHAIENSKEPIIRSISLNDDDFIRSMNRNNEESSSKFSKKAIIFIAVVIILLIVHLLNLWGIVLPIIGLIAVIALVVFVLKRMNGGQKSSSFTLSSQAPNGAKRSSGTKKLSFGRVVGAVAWAGILFYAASYYHNAGNPSSWTIGAVVIGIIGACVILFGIKKK